MPIQAIEYRCLCCQGQYMTNRHTCQLDLCKPEAHQDFCTRCRKLIMQNFARQMIRKALPAPKLRLEGGV